MEIPFPSFIHLMKPLSFVKGQDYEKWLKDTNLDEENKKKAVLKDNVKKSIKIANKISAKL
jgi:hypothetical protein